jgi:hypothetical protein
VHETGCNVMPVEHCMELVSRNLVVILESGGVGGPLGSHIPLKLLGGVARTLTQWHGASYPPQANQSARRTVVGESPGIQHRSPLPADGKKVAILSHDTYHS